MNAPDTDALLHTLETRFDKHMQRHQGLTWVEVQTKLVASCEVARGCFD